MQPANPMTLLALPRLQDDAWQYIQDLRARYYPAGYAFLPPHFTLFNLDPSLGETAVATILNRQWQAKISFCLRSALFMPPLHGHQGWYTFLVPDLGFSELAKLQRSLYKVLQPELEQNVPFIPHLTVGKFATPRECWQLVDEINSTELALSGWIEKISLVNGATVIAEVTLG